MKEEKWKSLGMEKQKVVEFEKGYREFYPKDYKNPECWQTDSEEEAYQNNKPKQNQKNAIIMCTFHQSSTITLKIETQLKLSRAGSFQTSIAFIPN